MPPVAAASRTERGDCVAKLDKADAEKERLGKGARREGVSNSTTGEATADVDWLPDIVSPSYHRQPDR